MLSQVESILLHKVSFYLKDHSQNTLSIDLLSVIELNVLSVWNSILTFKSQLNSPEV